MTNNRNFFIIAGERSGDIHGGMLMESIHQLDNSINFTGIGGQNMESQGLNSLIQMIDLKILLVTVNQLPQEW